MKAEDTNIPNYIVFMAENTFSPLFWDDEDVGIGDVESVTIGDEELSLDSFVGLEEWYLKANKYDPYTIVDQFSTEGMEEWINQGYEFVKQFRSLIPKNIGLYYGYWHQFGDQNWRYCKAYINP